MGVNKFKPHVLVVPEDDANRQLANGFSLAAGLDDTRISIHPPSGGWGKVLDEFTQYHIAGLRSYPQRHLVLLIDFDDQVDARTAQFKAHFPEDIASRVYVLGTRSEPEPLRRAVGQSLERVGGSLANECVDESSVLWSHELLAHNATELARLVVGVKPFLFP